MSSALEKLRVERIVQPVSVFTKQPWLFSAPHFRLARMSPVSKRASQANVKGLTKLARKIVLEISSQKML